MVFLATTFQNSFLSAGKSPINLPVCPFIIKGLILSSQDKFKIHTGKK